MVFAFCVGLQDSTRVLIHELLATTLAWPFLQVMSWEWVELIISNGEPAIWDHMGEHSSTHPLVI